MPVSLCRSPLLLAWLYGTVSCLCIAGLGTNDNVQKASADCREIHPLVAPTFMGLDISLVTDKEDELYTERQSIFELDYTHTLSRSFCNIMLRKDIIEGEGEFDQLGRIAGVNVEPLYEMETYPQELNLEYALDRAGSYEERQSVLQEAEAAKAKLVGNLDRVLAMVETLLDKLAKVPNLPDLVDSKQYNDPSTTTYFSDFILDTGNGYIGNNLGQDLRNFRNFLRYAKSKGSQTVWVEYG